MSIKAASDVLGQSEQSILLGKAVLVFGSFDLLHQGHRHFLQQSRKRGERLVVVLARDEEILHLKSRKSVWDFAQRKTALLETGLVDEVIRSDTELGSFQVLQNLSQQASCIVLGDGQEALEQSLKAFFQRCPDYACQIVHVHPHRRALFSSTRLHQLRSALAYVALLSALFFWASSWALGRIIASSGLYPPLASTLRMSLLAVFFGMWLLGQQLWQYGRSRKENPSPGLLRKTLRTALTLDKRNALFLVSSGFCFTIYNLCLFFGLTTVFSNQGGVLTSVLVPCFSALLYSWNHKVRLRWLQIWGLLIGLAGGIVLMGGLSLFFSLETLGTQFSWQSSLFIGTAGTWSILTLLSSKIQEQYSLQKYSFYTYLFAAFFTSWGWLWYEGGIDWLPLLSLVLVGSIIGTSLYFLSLRFLRPHHVASFLFLQPLFILFMSWFFLAEPWTWELSLGSGLAISAICLLNMKKKS